MTVGLAVIALVLVGLAVKRWRRRGLLAITVERKQMFIRSGDL